MKLSIDYLLTGLAVAVVGGGVLTLSAHSAPASNDLETRFTEQDYAAFNRGFEMENGVCDVGVAKHKICFDASPLEARISEGEAFPENMYPLALEWRASLAMPQKPNSLKTVRIGRTIALMDRDSRMVLDTMRLGEANAYAATETSAG